MPIFPVPAPPSSFHVGLRAVLRACETRAAIAASVPVPAVRTFATFATGRFFPRRPCLQYSAWHVALPLRAPALPIARHPIAQVQGRSIFTFRAITRYIDLPDWYEDAQGLPFRKEDLNQRESNQIFPSNLPAPQANRLLKIIHGRRVAGTLDDPILARNTREFRISDQKRALEYLRKHIPVDEVLNAGLRAEDELKLIEEQDLAAEETGNTSGEARDSLPASEEKAVEVLAGRIPRRTTSESPYGVSNFDRIRAENIAKREAEEARLEEERKRFEEDLAKQNIGTLQTHQAKPREISEWRKKHMERATSNLEAPPEMPARERLLPTFGMAALIVAGSMAFAALYQAPPSSRRLLPDIPPAAATCLGLIALNLAVYALWKFPPAWAFFNKYMIVVAATPRPLQILGAMFSHQSLSHLSANMIFLWFFGTRVHDEIGRGNFLALYLSSGAVGFAASLAHLVLWRGLEFTTLGASGAIYGILTAFFWMHKFDEFKVLGYPPDPIPGPQGLGFIGLILGVHLVPLFSKRVSNIDMASHFGGMLAGAVGIDLARYYMDYRARERAKRLESARVLDTAVEKNDVSRTVVDAPSSPSNP